MQHRPAHDEFDLPPGLEKGLKRLYSSPVEVGAEIDRVVLGKAQLSGLASQSSYRVPWRRLAAAAVVVLAGLGVYLCLPPQGAIPTMRQGMGVTARDVDGDGATDIVDAMTLARRVRMHDRVEGLPDLNGDGVVDARDADSLAQSVVRLTGGST